MGTVSCFSESSLDQLREICDHDPRVAALYAFDLQRSGECNVAAVYTETPAWPERLDSGVPALDLFHIGRLDFRPPDPARRRKPL